MRVLLTGGAGYIGAHVAIALVQRGHEVVVLDDLSAGSRHAVDRVGEMVGRRIPLLVEDACDVIAVERALRDTRSEGVIHLAGLKAVAESVTDPLLYYRRNLLSALGVFEAGNRVDIERIVFSSSATVYEDPAAALVETDRVGLDLGNPYGRTKSIIERMLEDTAAAKTDLRAVALRYFNPVGAHPSGRIGESPRDRPSNLLPAVTRVAVGLDDRVIVHGSDYATPDGTGVRDYIHVMDLAEAHVVALEKAVTGFSTFNLGTGKGSSVLEVLDAFERATGIRVERSIECRRDGDAAEATADVTRARTVLGWQASRDLDTACVDAWRWQQANPTGYPD